MKLLIFLIAESMCFMINNDFNIYQVLKCRIFILGNSIEGESIVFILYGDNKVLYSCVVDSFKYKNELAIVRVLKNEIEENISDLFWTHPHDDHAKGIIDIIKQFKPKNIYVPENLINLSEKNAKESNDVLNFINSYEKLDRRRKQYCPFIRSASVNKIVRDAAYFMVDKKVRFSIMALAPSNCITRRKYIKGDFNSLNDYSIAIVINVGDFSFLLTGDIQNKMIHCIAEELTYDISCPNILKIPHHGSCDSLDIMSLFDDDIDISITTSKKSSSLPKEDAIMFYKSRSEHVFKINDESDDLAIWGVEVDIRNATMKQICDVNYNEVL